MVFHLLFNNKITKFWSTCKLKIFFIINASLDCNSGFININQIYLKWTAKHWAIQIYLEGLTHFLKKADRIWKSSSTRLLSIVVGLLWLWSRYRIIGSLCRTSSKSSFWKAGRRFIIRSTGSDYIHLWSICSHSTANESFTKLRLEQKSLLFWMWNRMGHSMRQI